MNITQIAPHGYQTSPFFSLVFMNSLISILYDLQAHQTMVMSPKYAMHFFTAIPSLLAFLQLGDPFLHYPHMYIIFLFLSKADETLTEKSFLISAVTVNYSFCINQSKYVHTYSELTYSSPLDEILSILPPWPTGNNLCARLRTEHLPSHIYNSLQLVCPSSLNPI